MEFRFEFLKARIYINSQKKSLADIQKETGCDVLLNGGLYNMATFQALCHLKADGKVYSTDQYKYWGYGWNKADTKLQMVNSYDFLDNYICCTAMVKDRKATSLYFDSAQGGKRGRTAIGTLPDGKTVIFCSKDGTSDAMTPAELQQYCMNEGWKDAIMLDSGGSSQCTTPEGKVSSTRKVHNVLCFWLDNKTQEVNDTMAKKTLGQAGLDLIKNFEGCRLTAYKPVDTEKYWTIGWGHYGADVTKGMKITQERADELLLQDVKSSVSYVNNPSYVPITESLNQNQFDALVSFCFNCGAGNLKTLCANRTAEQIASKIPAYNKAGGRVLTGLVRRRAAEQALFNKTAEAVVEMEPTTVKEVQLWLNRTFSSGLTLDGLYGSNTKKALIKALQKEWGVTVDGSFGAKTKAAVKPLKRGDKGTQVKILQCFLICLKQKITADGSFGKLTETALKTVQSQYKIEADGSAGKITFQALCS